MTVFFSDDDAPGTQPLRPLERKEPIFFKEGDAAVAPLFIYFRHTPKQIKFLVSRDATPRGEAKKLIRRCDVDAMFADHALNLIKIAIRSRGGWTSKRRPDFAAIVKHLTEGNARDGGYLSAAGQLHPAVVDMMSHGRFSKVVFIAADARMGDRIMFVPAKGE